MAAVVGAEVVAAVRFWESLQDCGVSLMVAAFAFASLADQIAEPEEVTDTVLYIESHNARQLTRNAKQVELVTSVLRAAVSTLLACLTTTFCVYTLFGLKSLTLGGAGMGATADFLTFEGARTLLRWAPVPRPLAAKLSALAA